MSGCKAYILRGCLQCLGSKLCHLVTHEKSQGTQACKLLRGTQ